MLCKNWWQTVTINAQNLWSFKIDLRKRICAEKISIESRNNQIRYLHLIYCITTERGKRVKYGGLLLKLSTILTKYCENPIRIKFSNSVLENSVKQMWLRINFNQIDCCGCRRNFAIVNCHRGDRKDVSAI